MTENQNSGTCRMNEGVKGEVFGYGEERAVYITDRDTNVYKAVPNGICNICRCIPRDGFDHGLYGKRKDGLYAAVGQPYNFTSRDISAIMDYCAKVGLRISVTSGSTWNCGCVRIEYQPDPDNMERYKIAMNSSQWKRGCDPEYAEQMIEEVDRRYNETHRGEMI